MKNIFPLFDSVLSLSLCQINNTYTTHYWYSQSNTRNIFLSFLTDLFNSILICLLACQINTCCFCSSRELVIMNVNSFLALSWFSGHPDTISQSELDSISTPWVSHFTATVLQFCLSLPFNYRKQPILYTHISFSVITFWTLFLLFHHPTRYSQKQFHNIILFNNTYITSISTTICLCKQEASKSVTFISLPFPVTGQWPMGLWDVEASHIF